jgi:protein involved in polysaccharide export with SLBB domain
VLLFTFGCNSDHDPKGFFDPTATGRWQSHALVVPILNKLDIGVEQPEDEFSLAVDPTPADLVPSDTDYRIAPNDLLNITVSDLLGPGVETPRQERVTESGNVTLPSVGQIPASGKTESELEQAIIQAYRDAKLIENAQVSVQVIESRGKIFTVYGAVAHPGQYPILNNNFRVLDALVIAGDSPLGSDTLYVMRPIHNNENAANPATPATQPSQSSAAPTEAPFNVLTPSTAPSASSSDLEPPAPTTEGIEPATSQPFGNPPSTSPATKQNNEGNIPGGGVTQDTMVQPADASTMPATVTTATPAETNAPAASQPTVTTQTPAPAPTVTAETPAASTAPTVAAASSTTQPGEGSVVSLEGQNQQVGGVPVVQPTTAPGMQLAATATTQPADEGFTFNYPAGSTQWKEIRVPLGELKNGNMRYNIVIRPGDMIYIPGPAQGVYYVAGHVNRPGVYQIVGQRVTLKQAIVAAGMFDQLAIPERSEIVRRISGDKEVFAEVDLDRIFAGEDPDIFIKPNDTINVGTNILAPFIAAVRNGYRITYGFGFIYDKNFNTEAEIGRRP